jgi:hypothetical protein
MRPIARSTSSLGAEVQEHLARCFQLALLDALFNDRLVRDGFFHVLQAPQRKSMTPPDQRCYVAPCA